MKLKSILITAGLIYNLSIYAQKSTPDFTVTDVYGHTHSLYSDYLDLGKYVFIEFFSTGCGGCQFITPVVDTVFRDFGCNYGDIIFLGIEVYAYDPDVIDFANRYGMNFPAVSGNDGGGGNVFNSYGYYYTPYKILIDDQYIIIADDPFIEKSVDLANILSNEGLSTQSCKGNDFIFYSLLSKNDSVVGEIDYENYEVNLSFPEGTNLSNLVSTFVGAVNASVKINGIEQISGKTNVDFSEGYVIYEITSEEGITKDWTVNVSLYSGIQYLKEHSEIFPNPSKGNFSLILPNDSETYELTLFDITGKKIFSDKTNASDYDFYLNGIDPGIYILEISGDSGCVSEKILIQ